VEKLDEKNAKTEGRRNFLASSDNVNDLANIRILRRFRVQTAIFLLTRTIARFNLITIEV